MTGDRSFLPIAPKEAELLSVALAHYVFEQRRVIEVDARSLPTKARMELVAHLDADLVRASDLLERVRHLIRPRTTVPA